MEQIIEPINKELLLAELTPERLLCKSNVCNNLVFSVNCHNAPNVMQEIGRLRELAFRRAGAGTGKSVDIDEFDVHPTHPYEQIVIWDATEQQIIGGYRYLFAPNAQNPDGSYDLAMTELFDFSPKFQTEYLPYTLELGRSFVYKEGTNGKPVKNLYALYNLWEGIGTIIRQNPNMKYIWGKVTMYLNYDKLARDYILYFVNKYCADTERLVFPKKPLSYHHSQAELAAVFNGKTKQDDHKILLKKVREQHCVVPPLVNSYVMACNNMKSFGTSLNEGFGEVEETGLFVAIADVTADVQQRYMSHK